MEYRKLILNNLLDKYENSAHFFGNAQINRRVALSFTRKSFPVYYAGDRPQEKQAIHQAVAELQADGVLSVQWLPGEKGNLLKRVTLNLETLQKAYSLASRTAKQDLLANVEQQLIKARDTTGTVWIKELLTETITAVSCSRILPAPFPADPESFQLLLQTLAGVDKKGEEELSERIFSIRYLGHSKHFTAKTRSALIALARSRLFADPELGDEDILSEIGIVKTSAEILLAGPLKLAIDGKSTDLTTLTFGAVIDSHQASRARINGLYTSEILLVENKTIFHELIRKMAVNGKLLIYVGGFPGPAKRRFLHSLGAYAQAKGAAVYHWGDIDYGGFRIYRVLKETAFPSLSPLFMDESTLLRYKEMAEPLKPSYRQRLSGLLNDQRYSLFHPVISLMMTCNIRLEQEAILADSTFRLPF